MKVKVIDPKTTNVAPYFIPTIIRIQETFNALLESDEAEKETAAGRFPDLVIHTA